MISEEWRPPGLALELVNTRGRDRGPEPDRLETPAGLLDWLDERGILGPGVLELRRSPPEARVLHAESLRLREAIASAFESFSALGEVPSGLAFGIDRVLAAGTVSRGLVAESGGLRLVERPKEGTLLALLAPIALDAAFVLTRTDPGRLRRCASARCGAWFVDTSKGGRRKWCSMATCGNRAKATTHRRRRGVPARRTG